MTKKAHVFVGMSGGVDSSVSASLLLDAGYEVTGVFIKVWEPPFLPCTWREERRDAQRAAAHLGIPLVTLDLGGLYKKSVVDDFVSAYARGETPNPDVLCNREIKFGAFYNFAQKEGADLIATGHYAVRSDAEGRARLMRSADEEKDQTYFLWTVRQEVLKNTLFPIGGMEKSEVRRIADRAGLPNARKKDSQGICFLGDVDMATFLREFIRVESGDVVDVDGNVIGRHDGAILYTLGERHGFTVTTKSAESRPWFVVGKDVTKNLLVVAQKEVDTNATISKSSSITVGEWHMISGLPPEEVLSKGGLTVSLRYHQDPIPVTWKKEEPLVLESGSLLKDIAVGQSAVLYRSGECLGGGAIAHVGQKAG
jgi:tRNA-specific 2-thiouridylase